MARKLTLSGNKRERSVREEGLCKESVRRGVENQPLVRRRVIASDRKKC